MDHTQEQPSLFDQPPTPPRTLVRKQDPETSHTAAHTIDASRLEAMVLEDIEQAGNYGITQDELILLHPEFSYSSITARPAALKRKGLIFDSGERRKGRSGRPCAVLKVAKFRASESNDYQPSSSSSNRTISTTSAHDESRPDTDRGTDIGVQGEVLQEVSGTGKEMYWAARRALSILGDRK